MDQTPINPENPQETRTQAQPSYVNPNYNQIPKREPYGFTKQDGWFAFLITLIGFLFIRLVFAGGGGVSVTVFTVLFDAFLIWYMSSRQIKPSGVTWVYLALTLAFGVYFGLFGGGTLSFFVMLFLIALSAYTVYVISGARTGDSLRYVVSDTCQALFVTPLAHMDAAPKAASSSVKGKGSRRALYAFLGVVLALPLFAIVGSLLGDADPLFERIWDSLVSAIFERLHVTVFQFIIGIPVAMYLFGLMYGAIRRRAAPRTAEHAETAVRACRVIPLPFAMGAVIPLLVLYVLFFISQTEYLIAAFQGVTPIGITQAEYARRGFFELCAVCGINMLTLIVLYFFTKTEEAAPDAGFIKRCRPAGICAVLLCLFSMALAVMSLRKMLLYIHDLGLTQKRVFTSFFMIFLFIAFAVAIAGMWSRKIAVPRWIAVSGAAILLVVCFMDVNGLIARYNIRRYQENKIEKLDLYPMWQLGEAAVPPLAELLDSGCPEEVRLEAREILQSLYYSRYAGETPDWRSMTLERWNSKQTLERLVREGKIADYRTT